MQLTEEIVFGLIQSDQEFPVDFDDAWKWVEYSQKKDALRKLKNNFEKGIEYIGDDDDDDNNFAFANAKAKRGGQNRKIIFLTVDCFKNFCMMAGTPKGKEVRRYFLNCEKELKRRLLEERNQVIQDRQKFLVSAMISDDAVSRFPKFDDDFYRMIYRLYGKGWEKRDPKYRLSCVAGWTNKTVYDRLLGGVASGGVKDTLNKVNPVRENGTRKNKHHWHFKELGKFHLEEHIYAVKAIGRLIPDGRWDLFMQAIETSFPGNEPLQLHLWNIYEQIQMFSVDVIHLNPPYSE